MVRPSAIASLRRRLQPERRKRAKKLEKAVQRSWSACQVCASDESIQASMPSQSMKRLRLPPCLKNQSCKLGPPCPDPAPATSGTHHAAHAATRRARRGGNGNCWNRDLIALGG